MRRLHGGGQFGEKKTKGRGDQEKIWANLMDEGSFCHNPVVGDVVSYEKDELRFSG